jgi:hypothetical protein
MPKKTIRRETILSHGLREREQKGQKGVLICKSCQNVYFDKEWFNRDVFLKSHRFQGKTKYTTCPACVAIKLDSPEGIVQLSGDFLASHKQEVVNLVRGVENRQVKGNPLDRIISIKQDGGQLTITATKKELAVAIGKELRRAFKGSLKIRWARDEDFVRIEWERGES